MTDSSSLVRIGFSALLLTPFSLASSSEVNAATSADSQLSIDVISDHQLPRERLESLKVVVLFSDGGSLDLDQASRSVLGGGIYASLPSEFEHRVVSGVRLEDKAPGEGAWTLCDLQVNVYVPGQELATINLLNSSVRFAGASPVHFFPNVGTHRESSCPQTPPEKLGRP